MPKKTSSSRASGTGPARKTTVAKKSSSVKTHVGDVIGLGRSRAKKSIPEGEGRARGIEITPTRQAGRKPARAVGGVRGRNK